MSCSDNESSMSTYLTALATVNYVAQLAMQLAGLVLVLSTPQA